MVVVGGKDHPLLAQSRIPARDLSENVRGQTFIHARFDGDLYFLPQRPFLKLPGVRAESLRFEHQKRVQRGWQTKARLPQEGYRGILHLSKEAGFRFASRVEILAEINEQWSATHCRRHQLAHRPVRSENLLRVGWPGSAFADHDRFFAPNVKPLVIVDIPFLGNHAVRCVDHFEVHRPLRRVAPDIYEDVVLRREKFSVDLDGGGGL